MVFFCLVVLSVLVSVPAAATNYYCDPSSTGASYGTWADPWRSFDAIPETVGFFKPGDTVFFKRGQYFSGTLSINSSGVNGAPIVFMPYGLGNAPVLQYDLNNPAEASNINRMIIRLNQTNHVVIDGFELTDYGIPEFDHTVTANVGHGIYIYNAYGNNNGAHNVIKNCTISRLGAGITIDGGTYNTITGCSIRNMRMAINTPYTNWDDHGAVGITLSGSNNTITYNKIQDCWATSYDYQYDGGAIEMYGSVSNNSILYNTFSDNLGFMEFGSATGAQSLNNVVGYNLIINNGHIVWINVGNGFGVDVRNLQFFNNNIIETKQPLIADVTSLFGIFSTPYAQNVITLKNNIFYLNRNVNITDPILQPFNGPQLVHENNLYRMNGGSLGFSLSGNERYLNVNDDLFMDAGSPNPTQWNYDLRLSSSAINFGQITGITKDFYGRSVPFGNVPDAGISENINQVLPLQLISARGYTSNSTNTIEWTTTNDTLGSFEIEKSITGSNFKKIATVAVNNAGKYQYVDNDVTGDVQYYRIKVVEPGNPDFYSAVISIKRTNTATDISVFPNPAYNNVNIRMPGDDASNKEVVIYNISGAAVKRKKVSGSSVLNVNVSDLPHGLYVVQVINTATGKSHKAVFTK